MKKVFALRAHCRPGRPRSGGRSDVLLFPANYGSMCRMKTLAKILILSMLIAASFGCSSREGARPAEPNAVVVPSAETININTASKDELQRIPYIGERLAEEIIEHRGKYGPFRKAEHLMLLQGISDRRFREIRHLVRVD